MFGALSILLLAILVEGLPLKKRDTDLDQTRCPNFCAGTLSGADPQQYICGDYRLGPASLPSGIPLEGIAGIQSTYHRFGGLCPGPFLAKFTNATNKQWIYPPLNGFAVDTSGKPIISNLTITVGSFLDRFGSEYGTFMSPGGAPYAQRSLPPSNLAAAPGAEYPYNYRVYKVIKDIVVQVGPIAPWFGQPGYGLQFLMPTTVLNLVGDGFLSRVNLTADPDW